MNLRCVLFVDTDSLLYNYTRIYIYSEKEGERERETEKIVIGSLYSHFMAFHGFSVVMES